MLLRRLLPAPKPPVPVPAPEGLEILRVVHSPTARRLALRVDPMRGDICLVIPKRVSQKTAWKFADANRGWILTRLAKMHKPVLFTHGAIIPVFGIDRTIVITPTGGRTTAITLTDTTIDVQTPRADPATNIKRFLYQTLEDTVRPCANAKAASIGKSVTEIQLRDTRTRWGSCAPDGRMMLCWRLIFAPVSVIDYVVAHEVAHLKHMDHSKRFWDVCEQLSDDMHFAKDWLNRHGESLLKYGGRP